MTPDHFLRGAPIIAPPEADEKLPIENLNYNERWNRLKSIQYIFVSRWKNEYISELQRRKQQQNIKPNDFVIVKDDSLPHTEWRLGGIVKVIYGKDNKVRIAEIKIQNGNVIRSIAKLCILPISFKDNSTKISPEIK